MIETVSCRFCSSRCGLQYNIEEGALAKMAKAPCEGECPAGIDIPGYVRLVSAGRFDEAIGVIREKVPFPGVLGHVCTHSCESKCQRHETDEPISIRALKRVAFERSQGLWKQNRIMRASTGKRVAVIGSGPAGLTTAYYLALFGHGVTVFEALPVAGGMMRVGIPDYRLPRHVLEEEIREIEEIGVEIKTNSPIESLDEVFAQGFGSIFVALGAHKGKSLNITGEESEGVVDGVTFLRDTNLGKAAPIGKRVLVVGGGNVAADVARTAKRAGGEEIYLACLEKRGEMPANAEEVEEMLEEGILIHNSWGPKTIHAVDGKVKGIAFKRCTSVFDNEGRFNPSFDEGITREFNVDTIILAIGQSIEPDSLSELERLEASRGGWIKADTVSLDTKIKGVFAGGDAITGPATVVQAIAAGRKAASAIDRFFGYTGEIERIVDSYSIHIPSSSLGLVEGYRGRREIDSTLLNDISEEANRCFWCDMVTGNPSHPVSKGWSCRRGRAHTARRMYSLAG